VTSTTLRTILAAGALLLALAAPPALAQASALTSQQRVELNKLVQQRNRLAVELRKLDDQAAALLKQGRDATVVHAEQVSTQDQLDLAELRLAIFATRHGVAVPPLPGAAGAGGEEAAGDGDGEPRYSQAFARGRARAIERMRRDGLRFLASLDFEPFLRSR
jgi:hypothetical protein